MKNIEQGITLVGVLIVVIILFTFFLFLIGAVIKRVNKAATTIEIIIVLLYMFSLCLFKTGMDSHHIPYNIAVDPSERCYSPLSGNLTAFFYFLTFNISMLLVWTKNKILPPLMMTLSLIFIIIGIVLNFIVLLQISEHTPPFLEFFGHIDDDDIQFLFLFAPVCSIIIGSLLIYKAMSQEISETCERTYSNKFLNILNTFLAAKSRKPGWIIVLLFPVLFIVTLFLILFGQDPDSIVKVFTDTATWRLSQHIPPPPLDHNGGHYLCTVAASGHPKIVKPLRIGQRNGRPIIVNRQLLIANAFEEMIQDFSPKLHSIIRRNYDKYGYNLSKKINTEQLSNLTYFLMKPLEWGFLLCLYLFCSKPEQKINR